MFVLMRPGLSPKNRDARVTLLAVEHEHLVAGDGVHVHRHPVITPLGIEIAGVTELSSAREAHHEHSLRGCASGLLGQARRELSHDREPAQVADGHVALDALRRHLALPGRDDAGGEQHDVERSVELLADTHRLAHRRQVGLHERDAWGAFVTERAADDEHPRAARGRKTRDGAAEPVGATDDGHALSLQLERGGRNAPHREASDLETRSSTSSASSWCSPVSSLAAAGGRYKGLNHERPMKLHTQRLSPWGLKRLERRRPSRRCARSTLAAPGGRGAGLGPGTRRRPWRFAPGTPR